jgi:pimeloyl-ACP methyl ester carboxylesterase
MTPPQLSQALHAALPGSRLCLVAEAGHNVLLEQPEVVSAQLDRFLEELTRTV